MTPFRHEKCESYVSKGSSNFTICFKGKTYRFKRQYFQPPSILAVKSPFLSAYCIKIYTKKVFRHSYFWRSGQKVSLRRCLNLRHSKVSFVVLTFLLKNFLVVIFYNTKSDWKTVDFSQNEQYWRWVNLTKS